MATLAHWYAVAVTFYTVAISALVAATHHYYSTRVDKAPWWRSSAGRHVMSVTLGIGVTFAFLAVADVWPSLGLHLWYVWLFLLFGITSLPTMLTQRWLMMRRLHRRPSPNQPKERC